MKYLLLTLLFCLTACSGPQAARVVMNYSVPSWAEPYVASWRAEFQVSGPLTVGWAEDLDPKWSGWDEGHIAYCQGDSLIVVKKDWWDRSPSEARLVTLWHELAHCWGGVWCHDLRTVDLVKGSKHRRSVSVMYPAIDMTWPWWGTHSAEYVEDLRQAVADPNAFCAREETENAATFSLGDLL